MERAWFDRRADVWRALAALLVALQWLFPVTFGPSPATPPWLFSAACAAVLGLFAPVRAARFRWSLALLAAAVSAWALAAHPQSDLQVFALTGGLLLILMGAQVAGRDRTLDEGIAWGLLLAAATSSALGLLQYFGLSTAFAPWVSAARAGEAYANLRQPNQFTTLCWLGAAVLLWAPLPGFTANARRALMSLLAIGSAASVSRTGVLQGLLLTAMALGWPGQGRRERMVLCAVSAIAYWAAVALLPFVLEATTGALPARTLWGRISGGESCSSRTVLWSNVLHLVAQKPWIGWGWGELDYAHFMVLYPADRFCDILDNAHSLPLHLAVELGVPAAVLLCGGALVSACRCRPWHEHDPQRQLAWAIVATIAVHSLLEYPLWYGPFQFAFGVALAWLAPGAAPAERPPARALAAGLAMLLLASIAYSAWDYWRVSQIYLPAEQRRAAWSGDPLAQAQRSKLFSAQARFAELTLTPVTRDNAAHIAAMADEMLHYSPEPRVIERLIEAQTLLGREREAVLMLARFRAAFPAEYDAWRGKHGTTRAPP